MQSEVNFIIKNLVSSKPCFRVEAVQHRLSPFCIGTHNGAMVVPSPVTLRGNANCRQWCELLAVFPVQHLDYWLNVLSHNISRPIAHVIEKIDDQKMCLTHTLPCIYYNESESRAISKMVHITELVMQYNMKTCDDVLHYLWSIVCLGIILDPYLIDIVFEIENIDMYIASRLFEGEVDEVLALGGETSIFISLFTSSRSEYSTYQMISAMEKGADMNMLIQQQKQIISQVTFLGGEIPQVLAMSKQLRLSKDYVNYLEDYRGFTKVGSQLYHEIIHGSLLAPPHNGYSYTELDIKFPLFGGKSTNIPYVLRKAPRSFALFGGTSSGFLDYSNQESFESNTMSNFEDNDIRLI